MRGRGCPGGPCRHIRSVTTARRVTSSRSAVSRSSVILLRCDTEPDRLIRKTLWAGERTLIGRVADATDVAKAYLSLIEQDYLTGTELVVCGGSLLT